jgi:hypothetical protein
MNTYKKAVFLYYSKYILGSLGFVLLYSISFVTGNADNSVRIDQYYQKFSQSLVHPVKKSITDAHRESIQVA